MSQQSYPGPKGNLKAKQRRAGRSGTTWINGRMMGDIVSIQWDVEIEQIPVPMPGTWQDGTKPGIGTGICSNARCTATRAASRRKNSFWSATCPSRSKTTSLSTPSSTRTTASPPTRTGRACGHAADRLRGGLGRPHALRPVAHQPRPARAPDGDDPHRGRPRDTRGFVAASAPPLRWVADHPDSPRAGGQ